MLSFLFTHSIVRRPIFMDVESIRALASLRLIEKWYRFGLPLPLGHHRCGCLICGFSETLFLPFTNEVVRVFLKLSSSYVVETTSSTRLFSAASTVTINSSSAS